MSDMSFMEKLLDGVEVEWKPSRRCGAISSNATKYLVTINKLQ